MSKKKLVTDVAADGVSYLEQEGTVVRGVRVQDTDPVFEFNAMLRREIDKSAVTRKGSWAIPIGNIPMADLRNLVKKNPDLQSKDAEIRTKAWLDTLRQTGNDRLRTVGRNLIPDSMTPDKGSIILPGYIEKKMSNREETSA